MLDVVLEDQAINGPRHCHGCTQPTGSQRCEQAYVGTCVARDRAVGTLPTQGSCHSGVIATCVLLSSTNTKSYAGCCCITVRHLE